jgi:cation transport ATPase
LPFVLTVAGSTFAIWVTIAEWPTALMNSMSVLLIACPCALGLATPLAVWSTLSSLASQGLVVRQANLIDALARVDHVVFDKTGTLTDDRLYLLDVVTRSAGAERSRLLSWIAEVESLSSHPVARALATITTDPHTVAVSNVEVVIESGCGIFARFEDERGASHEMRIGPPDWIGVPSDSQETAVSPSARFASLHRDNGGRIDVELDGRLEAICILREKVRPSVTETVGRLKGKGIRVSILTGDRSENRTAEIVENVIGALRPHEKADVIDNWQRAGASCLYVGDGINDAPAMCKADAAIALGSGAELAKSAAPAVLNHGNLETVVFAVEACRRAVRTVNSNLLWTASYNAVGMAVAASGYLHPVAAALLMVGSSLLVSSRSLRLCT